jgi:hypothetical protein
MHVCTTCRCSHASLAASLLTFIACSRIMRPQNYCSRLSVHPIRSVHQAWPEDNPVCWSHIRQAMARQLVTERTSNKPQATKDRLQQCCMHDQGMQSQELHHRSIARMLTNWHHPNITGAGSICTHTILFPRCLLTSTTTSLPAWLAIAVGVRQAVLVPGTQS